MSRVGALIAVGRTSDVYEFGRGSVVKVPRPAVPRHWAAEEAQFTAAVRELGAPAPKVLDVVEVAGHDAIVFERVHGRSMWELIVERPRSVHTWGQELADVHRRILRAGLPQRVAGLVERTRTKIAAALQLTEGERDEALRVLDGLPRGGALLHGDLHPGNVLMSATGPVVIDWFDAAVGHPVADVVRSSVLLRPFAGQSSKPHLPGADSPLLLALHETYVGAMGDVLDRPQAELHEWERVVAVSRLAEGAEDDDAPLLALWRERHTGGRSLLTAMGSAEEPTE